jgi:DNA modification methylase
MEQAPRANEQQSNVTDRQRLVAPARLPTNTTTRRHGIHRWFNFIAGFSPEFVSECIDQLPDYRTQKLLDPFTGCGTAQVEGRRRHLDVVGYEAHPVFARIARAKLADAELWQSRLKIIQQAVLDGIKTPVSPNTLGEKPAQFLSKLFTRDILERLVGVRAALKRWELENDDLAFLVVSRILELTSHSQTDGIYKAPTSRKSFLSVDGALSLVVDVIRFDCAGDLRRAPVERVQIFEKTAETMSEVGNESVDLIVTSPPYLNNFDYAEMTRMHLYFWGIASSWGEISDRVRAKLIVNTTTALRGHRDARQVEYHKNLPMCISPELEDLVDALSASRAIKAGKKEYHLLVYPYFSQLKNVLAECCRVLRPEGHFHMMVADAALYGIHISAPQLLARMMDELGFREIELHQVRARGHRWILEKRQGSATGLGEYHISAKGR